MAVEVVIDLNTNPDKANQGVGSLRQQLKLAIADAQSMAEKFGETSQEAVNAAKKAAALKEQISDINDTINALSPEAKFNAVIGVAQGIAGGFAAAQGAMALFGAESENVQKALLKVQSAMAIAQGLNDIKGLSDGFKNLGIVIRSSSLYMKAAAAVQATYNAVVGLSTGALKAFRLALVSTGIGAILVLVGSAIAYWKEWTGWVERNSATLLKWGKIILVVSSAPVQFFYKLGLAIEWLGTKFDFIGNITTKVGEGFSWLTDIIVDLLEQVGVLDTKEEEAAEKRIERSQQREKQIKREIDLLKARGATEEEVAAKEQELTQEKVEAYKVYIDAKKSANRDITDDEKNTLEDLRVENILAIENLRKVQQDAAKKEQEERDKNYKKWLAEEKKRNEEAKKLQQELIDARISGIVNEREREEAQINESFKRRIAAITGQSQTEIELRKQLAQNQQAELANLHMKFDEEDKQAEAERLQRSFEDQQALLESQKIQAEIKQAETKAIEKEQAQLELQQALLDDKLSKDQKVLAQSEYDAKINELDKKSKDEQLANEQRLRDAKMTIAQGVYSGLTSIAELGIRDQKKQETAKKALALAQIGIDTAVALGSAIATANAPTPDNVASGGIAGIAKYITIAASVLGNAAKARSILGGGGGSPSSPSVSSGGGRLETAVPRTNVPQSEVNRLPQGNQFSQPVEFNIKASIVETDITKTQKKVSDIEENATF